MATILFVLTAADHWTLADGTENPTGFWAEEAIGPYQVFKDASASTTAAAAAAKAWAVSQPMPKPAPVTTATWPPKS